MSGLEKSIRDLEFAAAAIESNLRAVAAGQHLVESRHRQCGSRPRRLAANTGVRHLSLLHPLTVRRPSTICPPLKTNQAYFCPVSVLCSSVFCPIFFVCSWRNKVFQTK